MERSARETTCSLGVEGGGISQSSGTNFEHCVKRRATLVDFFDAVYVRLREREASTSYSVVGMRDVTDPDEVNGREVASRQASLQLGDGCFVEIWIDAVFLVSNNGQTQNKSDRKKNCQ